MSIRSSGRFALLGLLLLATAPVAKAAFVVNADGTVTDTVTGLMWDQCTYGLSTATTACDTGTAGTYTWSAALQLPLAVNALNGGAGYKTYKDWRLPNKNELATTLDLSATTTPLTYTASFPNTPATGSFWSSTTFAPTPANAWALYFGNGRVIAAGKGSAYYVRLVRAGQAKAASDSMASTTTAPTVTTVAASSLTATGATLNGTVSSNGAVTTVTFDYGTSDSYGSSATAAQSTLAADASGTAVSAALTLLSCNTTYHFRVKGVNSAGTTNGSDVTFSTAACPATVPGAPTGVGGSAGDTQVTVSWTAPSSTGGSAITGYQVQVSTASGGTYANAAGSCAPASTNASTAVTCTATGLTNGTPYYFKVAAINGVGTGSYSAASSAVTPATVVDGACATIGATAFVPTTGLCISGTAPAAATEGSPWTWSCTGSGGGATVSCSAPNASTATGTGNGRAIVSGGTWAVDAASSAGFIPATGHAKSPPTLPPGVSFPHGLLDFVLTGSDPGSTATITITYPADLPAGTVYWKYGPEPGDATAHWYQFPGAVISGNTITLTITDGLQGDDDLLHSGVIADPGGPGEFAGTTDVPTLSEWGLILLSLLLALLGVVQVSRLGPRAR